MKTVEQITTEKKQEFLDYLIETANEIVDSELDSGDILPLNERIKVLWEGAFEDFELEWETDDEEIYGQLFDSIEDKLIKILA